jgi:hypothetical protein
MLDAGCWKLGTGPLPSFQHLLLRSLHVALQRPETMKNSFQFSVFSFQFSVFSFQFWVKYELKTEI